jgi:hypothetical protein
MSELGVRADVFWSSGIVKTIGLPMVGKPVSLPTLHYSPAQHSISPTPQPSITPSPLYVSGS